MCFRSHRDPAPWIGGTRGDHLKPQGSGEDSFGLRTTVERRFLPGPTLSFQFSPLPNTGPCNAHTYFQEVLISLTPKSGALLATPPFPWNWS